MPARALSRSVFLRTQKKHLPLMFPLRCTHRRTRVRTRRVCVGLCEDACRHACAGLLSKLENEIKLLSGKASGKERRS
jgi:hypothetical protein